MSRRTKKDARRPYCSVCNELEGLRSSPDYRAAVLAVFDKLDRIHRMRVLYGRRRR